MSSSPSEKLLLPSGGYTKLKSFQLARLIYDITFRFAKLYIPSKSRTADQMVQAARSGVQNIAEGSIDAATSAKIELNLYNVARGSLEELKLDYQDFLRQHQAEIWTSGSLLYQEFVSRKVATAAQFRDFIDHFDRNLPGALPYRAVLVANSAILLISAASFILLRQIEVKSEKFLADGGFSEQMYRMRLEKRK